MYKSQCQSQVFLKGLTARLMVDCVLKTVPKSCVGAESCVDIDIARLLVDRMVYSAEVKKG
jgi:hypothetical protein